MISDQVAQVNTDLRVVYRFSELQIADAQNAAQDQERSWCEGSRVEPPQPPEYSDQEFAEGWDDYQQQYPPDEATSFEVIASTAVEQRSVILTAEPPVEPMQTVPGRPAQPRPPDDCQKTDEIHYEPDMWVNDKVDKTINIASSAVNFSSINTDVPSDTSSSDDLVEAQGDPSRRTVRGTAIPPSAAPWNLYRVRHPETGIIDTLSLPSHHPVNAWRYRHKELTDWTRRYLVNRLFDYGSHLSYEARDKPNNKGTNRRTAKGLITDEVIQSHYFGYAVDNLIGLHTTHRDQSGKSWCRWGVIDIDRHDDATDKINNWNFVRDVYEKLTACGITPLLEDSNGNGGYHLWVIFECPIASETVFDLMKWLVRDYQAFGLAKEPEVFPKQRFLPDDQTHGNWVRLPGRHHTRNYWSLIWNGLEWLEGNEAIDVILRSPVATANQIPAESSGFKFDSSRGKHKVVSRGRKLAKPQEDEGRLAEDALQCLGHLASDYESWLQIGMCLSPLGEAGLAIWTRWSSQIPEKFSESVCSEKWATFTSGKPNELGLGTLFRRAQEAGWPHPKERYVATANPGCPATPLLPKITVQSPIYHDGGDHIRVTFPGKDGEKIEQISHFSARILESITLDDGGQDPIKSLLIEARSSRVDGSRKTSVTAADYSKMEWPLVNFGPDFIVLHGFREHVRTAIQEFSIDLVERTVYTHTGWRRINGSWAYLHAGGAITKDGNDTRISVQLFDTGVHRYRFPDPPEGVGLVRAIRASLGILRLANSGQPGARAAAAVLFAATYRSAIQYTNFAIQVYGLTGSLKTSTFALAQQHFGCSMDPNNLPASWASDTPLAIGEKLSRIGDGVMMVDDLVFRGGNQEIAKLQADAQSLIQQVGNHAGRQRLKQDGSPRPSKPPNCLMVSTGEDRISTGSADARTLPIRFTIGMIDKQALRMCQREAADGLYAEAMAGYLHWLAPKLDDVRGELNAQVTILRDKLFQEGDHGRTPEILAHLIVGAETALRFALEVKAIDHDEHDKHLEQIRKGLAEVSGEIRSDRGDDFDPCQRFLDLIRAGLESGQAYLSRKDNEDVPSGLESLSGWRLKNRGGCETVLSWETFPNANRIGWVDDEYVYLHPANSYRIARKVANEEGIGFSTSPISLNKMLSELGLIELTSNAKPLSDRPRSAPAKKRYTTRIYLGMSRTQVGVLKFPRCKFWGESEISAQFTD